ncbi:MAG: PorP/SprF family type IX secretion system membrane protein [Bacteroidetes bacterium]|nr:PorP/SprF family type IX secretion system membrane protein [Bacteroidota bacterium]
MKKIIISLSVFVGFCTAAIGQDLNFSQYYETPLLRNPALAGIFNGDVRIKANYRNQWGSIAVPFKTFAASGEYKMPLNNASGDWATFGLQATSDVAGDVKLKKTSLLPVVSFNKSLSQINNSYLSIAFMGGAVNTSFNSQELKLISPQEIANFSNFGYTYYDVGAGLTYSSDFGDDIRYYVGAAMYHINNPKLNFFANNSDYSILGRKLVLNGGISAQTSDNNKVQGFIDYIKQDGNEQFLAGMLYGIDFGRGYKEDNTTFGINFGTFFRWGDAIIPVINFDIDRWNIGFSYDVNISKLNTYSQYRGGLELSATYRANLNRRTAMGAAVRCPTF